ncbi:MAG: hypothetical protein WAW37_05920, partial [Syntrophobacteraceae bacterium]
SPGGDQPRPYGFTAALTPSFGRRGGVDPRPDCRKGKGRSFILVPMLQGRFASTPNARQSPKSRQRRIQALIALLEAA